MTYDPYALDAILRTHLPSFARKAFSTLHSGRAIKWNWHLDAIAHQLERVRTGENNRLIVNVAPRSWKSEFASVVNSAFVLGHDPTAELLCISNTQELASKFSRDTRRVLESEWYQRIFPSTRIGRKCTEERIETTAGSSRLATSFGAAITGFGGSLIIIDDPTTPGDAMSPSGREKIITFYRETLFSRLNDKEGDKIILVMQRLHEDDLAGYLLREEAASC